MFLRYAESKRIICTVVLQNYHKTIIRVFLNFFIISRTTSVENVRPSDKTMSIYFCI